MPKSRLRLASGEQSRYKQVAISLDNSSQAESILGVIAQAMRSDFQCCFDCASP
jgi:hypothetical protein